MSKKGDHDVAKTLAALFGAPLAALAVGAALTRLVPGSEAVAFAWGVHSVLPLWAFFACVLPLAKSGRRAWLVCLALVLPATAIALAADGIQRAAAETAR